MSEMLHWARQTGRYQLYVMLGVSGAVSCAMVAWRVREYDSVEFTFLVWNLFLAGIPFLIGEWTAWRPPARASALAAALLLWLLFFPNAPYLATDLMHLSRSQAPVPFWFDLVLLLSFAWNGLMLGFLSMLDVHRAVDARFGRSLGWTFIAAASLLGGLGIYIGRYLRWNSWEVFTQPGALLGDVGDRLLHPAYGPSIYGVTAAFAAFLLLGYLVLRSLVQIDLRPAGAVDR